jgi:DNA-binding GntR family transcriptional regulator
VAFLHAKFKIQNHEPLPFLKPGESGMKRNMKNLGATHRNLDAKVYDQLKAMILEGRLVPGDKVFQDKLAQEMGVSRTPLVNALKVLEQEKLIKAIPRRGFYVRRFTKEEMIYIFELREVLEGLAARRAAELITQAQIKQVQTFFEGFKGLKHIDDYSAYAREDRRFHNFITDLGGKEFLKSILTSYNVVLLSYQVSSYGGLVRHPDETLREHLAIIEAVKSKNAVKAEEIMRLHMKKSLKVLRKNIEARENPDK